MTATAAIFEGKNFKFNSCSVHSHFDASRSWEDNESAWDMLDDLEIGESVTDEQGDAWTRTS